MPNNETTTKFKVDISELKAAMQTARKEVALSNSEFKAVSSSMDDWSKSSEGISAKLKQLNTNLKAQETVLEQYEKTLEEVKKEYGENSKEAMEYATKLNNQQAVVNKIKKEISGYEESLEEVSNAEKKAAKTGKTVAEVLDDVGEEAKDAEGGFTVLKGAIATFAGNTLTSMVGGVKDLIGSFINLASETREYRNEMSKLETAFTTAGGSAKTASNTYKQLYAVLGDEGQTVEASNHLAQMTTNQKELNKWTHTLTGVYAKFGASLPIEGLTEASNETAKTGQLTGSLADALNWAGVNEESFQESLDNCNSEQERQKLILETLNGLYGEAGTKYKETNKSVMDANKAQAEYTETLAELGAKAEPITTAVKKGFTGLLQEGVKLIEGVDIEDFTAKIEEGFTVVKDEVIPAVINGFKTFKEEVVPVFKDEVIPAVKDGLGWIIDNKDIIISGLSGIAAGFLAFKVAGIITAVATALKAFSLQTALAAAKQWLLNTALLANPIILIVTLIVGLVAALITFIATNEDARKKIGEVWDKVSEKIAGFVEKVKVFFTETIPEVFKSLIEWVKTNWQSILLFLINPFAGLFKYFYENNGKFKEFVDTAVKFIKELPKKIWTWLVNAINKVTTWRKNMITKAKETALGFINKVIEYVKQLPLKVWNWLVNVITKIVTWRLNMINKAKEAALGFINKVIEYVKQLPQKVSDWLKKVIDKVGDWGTNLSKKGKEAAKKLYDTVVEKVSEITGKIKSIGQDIVTGLWNGINDKVQWLKNQIKSFVGDVTQFIKDKFKIGSPSKLMEDEVGRWLPEGIAVGISKNAKSVLGALKDVAVTAVSGARAGLSTATTTLGSTGTVGGTVNNFYQTINSPKQLSRLDIYRQSKNLLGYAGGGF